MRPTDASASFRPDPAALARAADADRVVTGAGAQLNYLSAVSVSLGLPDPVQEYYGPIVGRWRDLHDEAAKWRRAAHAVEELASGVTSPLGRLDAVWQGAVSDSFIEHMRQIGRAGVGASDAMSAMAEALDKMADAMHQLVTDTVDLLSGGADRVSLAMLLPFDGEARAGSQIAELCRHGRRMLETVHELLEAFARLCQGMDERQPFAAVTMAAAFPAQNWAFTPDLPVPVPPPGAERPAPAAEQPDAEPPPDRNAMTSAPGGGSGVVGGMGASGAGAGGGGAGAAAAPPEPGMRTFAAEPGVATSGSGQAAAASASPVAGSASGGARGAAAGVPFFPMVPGMAGQGGDTERSSKSGLTADPVEIFGEPTKTAPPVIGDD